MSRRFVLLTVLAVVCLVAAPGAALRQAARAPAARSTDILPFTVTETTLANGLRVIVIPTGFPNLVSVQIPVQTGSRNEVEPGKTGFAHFFEHLMFRGTPKFPPEKYRDIMVKAGARENAGTNDDFTRYYATFAKEDTRDRAGTLRRHVPAPVVAESDFKTEARAILGEYNKNSANPLEKLFEVQRDHAFTTHTYKHTTMGFIKDIEAMPNEYRSSKVFFERWYRPNYTTIVVAGDVDPARTVAMIERSWGGWKGGTTSTKFRLNPRRNPPSTCTCRGRRRHCPG